MNFKLYNLLTVCLATSALLVPVQKAFGAGLTKRTNEEKIQHLVCVKETQYSWQCQVENSQHEAIESNKSMPAAVAIFTQQNSVAQINQYENINPIEVLLLLVCVGSISSGGFLFLYIKHCNNQAAVLRRNIEVLERLWMLSSYQSKEKL
jgi:hypothetical protein